MKHIIFIFALISIFVLFSAGCYFDQESISIEKPLSDAEAVAEDKAALESDEFTFETGDNINSVTMDFTLPVSGDNGTDISWESVNGAVVIDGSAAEVNRPLFGDGDISVIITATIAKGNESESKAFTITVLKKAQRLIIYSSGQISDGSFTEASHQGWCETANSNEGLGLTTVKPFISRSGNNIKDISGVPAEIAVSAPNGAIIGNNWSDLWDGSIQSSLADVGIVFTDNKDWWSGSNSDGTENGNTCSNWTSSSSGDIGQMGLRTSDTGQWSGWAGTLCQWTRVLLCVGWDE